MTEQTFVIGICIFMALIFIYDRSINQRRNKANHEKPNRDIKKPSVRVNQEGKRSKSSPKTPKDKAQHPRKYKSIKKKVKK